MKHYDITIISNNKQSVKDFIIFLKNCPLNIKNIKKYSYKKTKKKIVTVLKSPHVNKTAQEQFEIILFRTKLSIFSFSNLKSLIFFKKLKNSLFPDIKIKIKFNINNNFDKQKNIEVINPINYKLNYFSNNLNQKQTRIELKRNKTTRNLENTNNSFKKLEKLLSAFDYYGELSIKV